MSTVRVLSLEETESRVCDIAAEYLGINRAEVHPGLRMIQDLHCDSLDLVGLFMKLEDALDVSLPQDAPDPACKAVFTRDPYRLRDLAEAAYLRQSAGTAPRSAWRESPAAAAVASAWYVVPFTQLGGRLAHDDGAAPLYESLAPANGRPATYRRRTDGMICVALPGGDVVLGSDDPGASTDEHPTHRARLDPFLIDREPVSTTAYCRFLNSIGPVELSVLERWFVLPETDTRRRQHELVRRGPDAGWAPVPGTEHKPMVLVSWYGACAYALWANGRDWCRYDADDGGDFLPSEAQWEYAARGTSPRRFPWGNDDATCSRMRYGRHVRGQTYTPDTLPIADVNEPLGVSPFGLHHMAGNVWQWCRDWYADDFYATPGASAANPVNRRPYRVRSERGGSWIGSADLCRSSYRRGRVPSAKGRCLGFRCAAPV